MTYVFDIDNTICKKNNDDKYENCVPINERIKKINELHKKGHVIIFHTARGMGRHNNDIGKAVMDFYDLTVKQLRKWGVKYHGLFMGKPSGDIYIDDKGMSDENFFNTKN